MGGVYYCVLVRVSQLLHVQMFGYPAPKVPKNIVKGAQGAVDLLKQESSVEAFGAIHEKVKDDDGKDASVRGASLRELKKFFEDNDENETYAGLRRIADDNDGTALWTCVPEDKVAQKLEERIKRRKEHVEEVDAEKQKSALDKIEETVIKLNDKKCCAIA